MIQLITAVLISAAQAPIAADVQVANLPEVFAAACLNGEARLAAGDATTIEYDDLPFVLRSGLGRPMSGKVWRLNTSGHAYLYVLNYAPGRGVSPKICGLASDGMSLSAAADLLDLRLAGSIYPDRPRSTQWLRPEDGYVATATTAGNFNVVQVNWLSDEDRAAAIDELRSVSR